MAIKFLNKGNSKSIPNIFMQEIEPSIKNGIWLKSSQTFNNLIITDKLSSAPVFTNIYSVENLPENATYSNTRLFKYNGNIYIAQNNFLGILNLEDMTVTQVYNTLPFTIHESDYYTNIVVVGNDIFVGKIFSNKIIKYNLEENTVEDFITLPNSGRQFTLSYYNGNLYVIVYYNFSFFYKINISQKIVTSLAYPDNNNDYLNGTNSVVAGNKMYMFSGVSANEKAFCFDLDTEIYENLPDIAIEDYGFNRLYYGTVLYYNNVCYILGGSEGINGIITYNIQTKTYGVISSTGYSNQMGIFVDNIAYIFESKKVSLLEIPFLNFKEKSIILDISQNTYTTKLVEYDTTNITGDITFKFNDANYNDASNKLIQTLPTYYGNGTEWIKFKN